MKCDACILWSCIFWTSADSLTQFTKLIPSIFFLTSWDNVFFFVNFLGLVVFSCCLGSGFAHLWWLRVNIELGWIGRMERSTCHCIRRTGIIQETQRTVFDSARTSCTQLFLGSCLLGLNLSAVDLFFFRSVFLFLLLFFFVLAEPSLLLALNKTSLDADKASLDASIVVLLIWNLFMRVFLLIVVGCIASRITRTHS